jgi:hypothetical protein
MPSKFETELNRHEVFLRTILWSKIDYATQDDATKKLLRGLWECGVLSYPSHSTIMVVGFLASEIIKCRMRAERAALEAAED